MSSPHIALLPLYLALYDEVHPSLRESLEPFRRDVAEMFTKAGVQVTELPICCVRSEFEPAVARAVEEDVDLLVTLHLAYSPSLESADALAMLSTPLLILDVTPDASFDQQVDPNLINTNHGIHGVQDLANLLLRRGKSFHIVAGHLADGRTAARAVNIARAASAAKHFRTTKALRLGPPFVGMGDFQIESDAFARLGIETDEIGLDELAPFVEAVSDEAVAAEMARDRERFHVTAPEEVLRRSVKLSLGVAGCLQRGGYSAWSMNFNAFNRSDGPVATVPFLAACKLMAEGVGYGGEGDLLTAALVGCLQRAFGRTTFTEIFCADWQGGAIFLSHMGEANPEVAAAKPLLYEKDYPFSPTNNPATLAFAPKPGPATLVNLAPLAGGRFRLICAPVQVEEDVTGPAFAETLRAWIRPRLPVADFLESYSRLGGTHHSALDGGRPRGGAEGVRGFHGIPIHAHRVNVPSWRRTWRNFASV